MLESEEDDARPELRGTMADGTRATDEIFLNEENGHGWQEEASAVIRDVRDFVKDICFAEKLQVHGQLRQGECNRSGSTRAG